MTSSSSQQRESEATDDTNLATATSLSQNCPQQAWNPPSTKDGILGSGSGSGCSRVFYSVARNEFFSKPPPPPKITRPPNAFILYRSDHQPRLVLAHAGSGKSSRDFSSLIGQQWRNEPAHVRQYYQNLAAEKMRQLRAEHPEFQYRPKSKPRQSGEVGKGLKRKHAIAANKSAKFKESQNNSGDMNLASVGNHNVSAPSRTESRAGEIFESHYHHRYEYSTVTNQCNNSLELHDYYASYNPLASLASVAASFSEELLSDDLSGVSVDEAVSPAESESGSKRMKGMAALLEYQQECMRLRQMIKELEEENLHSLQQYGIPALLEC